MDLGFCKSLIFVLLQLGWVSGDSEERPQLEKDILQTMFLTNKFHTYVRPYKNINQTKDEALEVYVSLYILNIDVDVKNQECSITMYFRQEWNDSRLIFNNQGKISALSTQEVAGLWTPDLFFVTEKLGHLHALTKPNIFVKIYPEGRVLYSQRITIKTACRMDLRKYPFDTQICSLPIESYGYTAADLVLKWKPDTTFGIDELTNFQVSYSTVEEITQMALHNYSRITLKIHLTTFIYPTLIHVYLPLILLVATSWISFYLQPSNYVSRLTTVVIITFTTLIFIHSVKEFFYPLCYLTALDVWVGFSCFLIFATVFENIYVTSGHGKGAVAFQKNKKDVPELPNEKKDKWNVGDILAGKLPSAGSNVDMIARLMCPSIFVLFNIIYLAYYLI